MRRFDDPSLSHDPSGSAGRPGTTIQPLAIPKGLHQQRLGENREGVDGDLRALGPRPGGAEHHDAEFVLTEDQPR